MSNLLVIKGPNIGIKYPLTRKSTIGRAPENTIQIPDPNISRFHCEIIKSKDSYIVRDLNSKNGVRINHEQVQERTLNRNDEISIGTTSFLFDTDGDVRNTQFSNKRVYFTSPNEETIMRLTPIRVDESEEAQQWKEPQSMQSAKASETRELLCDLGKLFPSPDLPLPDALEGILHHLLVVFKSKNGCLMTWDRVGNEFVPMVTITDREEFSVSLNMVRTILKEKTAVLIPYSNKLEEKDINEAPTRKAKAKVKDGKAALGVPLLSKDNILGLLYLEVQNSERLILHDVQLIQSVANMAQAAIERSLSMDDLAIRKELEEKAIQAKLIGESKEFKAVLKLVDRVAGTDSTVLLTGETGTGKEMIARELHNRSPRCKYPFLAVNCAAIPENLIESELFGHEKGAFTGADRLRRGLAESAHGGTLFLDEIGEMAPAAQTKLLRFLQERVITRVGGTQPIRVDVRIIAATNIHLESAIQEKKFREDLWYRLNVFEIHLPPLRERTKDIPLMARYFLKIYGRRYNKQVVDISEEALLVLSEAQWPGNIRELLNAIERAILLCDGGTLEFEHFSTGPASRGTREERTDPMQIKAQTLTTLADAEKDCILRALEISEWNQAKASRLLQIHRNTLRKKIVDLNLSPKAKDKE